MIASEIHNDSITLHWHLLGAYLFGAKVNIKHNIAQYSLTPSI
jgi:hypothetical protein